MKAFRRVVRDGVIREYHRLGCRTTEVVHLLSQPRANVQRAIQILPDPPVQPPRKLTGLQQRVLVAFWYEFHGQHGLLNPPPLGAAFLQSFCDLCRSPAPRRRGWRVPELTAVDGGVDEVFAAAVLLCAEYPDPDECLAGPARFALLCAGLRCVPWTAAVFLTQHVSRDRIWVRRCYRCDHNFISPSAEHRHCGCSPHTPGAPPLRSARLARAGLSLLR